jgi:membrane-associated phospholipid phosphatase
MKYRTYLLTILFFSLASSFPAHLMAGAVADKKLSELKLQPDGLSVYKLNFWTDASLVIASSIIVLGTDSLSYQIIHQSCPCDSSGLNFIDRPVANNQSKALDIAANYTVTLAMIAPVIIDYLDVGLTKSFGEDMVVYSDVLAVNFGMVTILKYAVQRPYPYVYQKKADQFQTDPTDYLSFYSGHTSTVFSALTSAAVTINLRHHRTLWPWVLTAVAGTSIGLELILSGEHFTTDVVVGALTGIATGVIVPGLHARDKNWFNHLYATVNQGTPSLMAKWNF